ncbi:MAG TPA: hypothetical protein ENF34_01130 [Candidatus Bathyarchaeota archaeon]|nr:hypothetical protein [Candidatus Bathyarchaeota archaeon]
MVGGGGLITISGEVRAAFPTLRLAFLLISGVQVERSRGPELQALIEEGIKWARDNFQLATLKDVPIFRAYRDFFWRLGIDPTKERPSAEALVRRVLSGKPFPAVSNLVDAYNLASLRSCVPIATFDADAVVGQRIELRFARRGEQFLGIGMARPRVLSGKELVMADAEGPIAIYPYRDADRTKITERTRRALVVACGAPGVDKRRLIEAARLAADYITRFCGGEAGEIEVV